MRKFWLLAGLLCVIAAKVSACIIVTSSESDAVKMADETAVIVWDAEKKEEHFIRKATFTEARSGFGFLVPTPGRPVLKAVNEEIFGLLGEATRREVVVRSDRLVSFDPLLPFFRTKANTLEESTESRAAAAPSGVEELDRFKLGDYDATVLKARDPAALVVWMKTKGLATSPELKAWLKPYASEGWYLTAFQVSSEAGTKKAFLPAVKMRFPAERPFYPYREPGRKEQTESRSLRVYLLASERMDAQLNATSVKEPWAASVYWSDGLPSHVGGRAERMLELSDGLSERLTRLTVFDDYWTWKQRTADLYWSRSASQDTKHPVPDIRWVDARYHLPADVLLGAGFSLLVGLGFWRKRGRERKR